ncbi:MAG: GNAT family N-acetyltransferase [Candidatus Aenigmarchaeota archaeon]|nr:GNAT family N-acetyltransferase [Candidatus Aenigmarchaeota archaeon]
MTKKFIPIDFKIPEILETDRFRLRMLRVNDVDKDYDAVMTSMEHLQKTKPFGPTYKWPTKDLTFEQDLIDLGWHQKEFQQKSSFAFTVMNLDETECLGCMYIYPSDNPNYDAIIMMWVRQSEIANGLDEILFSTVKKWIKDKWSFNKVAYPGRAICWDEFE